MKRRGPNWDNHCMRKFGGSIRQKIKDAYAPFKAAHKLAAEARQSEAVIETMFNNINEQTIH